jgi:membrane associated rhomboid family serine protease
MAYRGGSIQFGYGLTPWVQRLLIANFAVFVITMMVQGIANEMAFVPALMFLRPWTLLTYMFVHANFMHIFFNMIGLFFFGPPLESRWGSTTFIKFYLFCGLGGAVFSFLFAYHSAVVGASGAVYGIMLAFAINWPNMPIYIWGILPVPAKYLVGVLVVMSLMSVIGGAGGNIAHFAHMGGFVFALIHMKLLSGGGSIASLRDKLTKRRMKVVRGSDDAPSATRGPSSTEPPQPKRPDPRVLDEVDRVLDKIRNEGMSSLTPAERRLLDDVSRKYRQN